MKYKTVCAMREIRLWLTGGAIAVAACVCNPELHRWCSNTALNVKFAVGNLKRKINEKFHKKNK